MTFSFHPKAEKEFFSAIEYFEEHEPGLGKQFSVEVTTAIANAADFPTAWPAIEDNIRRCLTHRFPDGIVYATEEDSILILAVMNLRREPGYWKSRTS